MDTSSTTPSTAPTRVLTGRFVPGEECRYTHVPFDAPSGVRQLHLRAASNDRIGSDPTLGGGNTLDLGLFDERGTEGGGPGFRGWSGSELLAVTVGEDWATPPYRPGPIGAGIWHVLLGPYKIGPRGLDWRVEVWFNPGLPAPPPLRLSASPSLRPSVPPPAEPGWVRGDLHCHTRHSDGDSWPNEVLAAAAAAGLDFLGITDHNAAIPHLAPAPGSGLPVLIPGVEVTTYGGHWNAWGAHVPPGEPNWFDFRDPTNEGTQAAVEMALARGAFVSVNHPKPFGPPWTYPDVRGHHAVEVWNGFWERLNATSLAYWDERLRRGERLVAVGGSDTHHLRPDTAAPLRRPRLGEPTTWVHVGGPVITTEAVLAGLRAGRCFVSASPAGPQLYLEPNGEEIRLRAVGATGAALLLLTNRGCIAAEPVDRDDQAWRLPLPPDAYVRAELLDGFGNVLALTNPIWRAG